MEADLLTQILLDAAVQAIVADRGYWGVRNAGEPLPALVLHKIAGRPDYTLDGADGLTAYLIQADCLGATALGALTLANAVRAAFGRLAAPFRGIGFVQDERSDFFHDAQPDPGGATDLHRASLDVRVWRYEA